MDRLFLDANVLFSAAYRAEAGVARLWSVETATLCSSPYAVDEARRNLRADDQRLRLEELVSALHLVETTTVRPSVAEGVVLPAKDWPIMAGAMAAEARHLITGDMQHFGAYFQKRIAGILVLTAGDYLRDIGRTF